MSTPFSDPNSHAPLMFPFFSFSDAVCLRNVFFLCEAEISQYDVNATLEFT